MKKTYISPIMEVMLAETEQILIVSGNGTNVYNKNAKENLDVLSKRRGDYDDEDDIIPSIW